MIAMMVKNHLLWNVKIEMIVIVVNELEWLLALASAQVRRMEAKLMFVTRFAWVMFGILFAMMKTMEMLLDHVMH